MSTIKSKYLALAIAAMTAGSALAAEKSPLKVYDAEVTINQEAGLVNIDLQLNLKDFKIGRNGEAIFTPMLISSDGENSIEFEPITICGRNRWYFYLRHNMAGTPTSRVYRSGSKDIITLAEQVQWQDWMAQSEVDVICQSATCCAKPHVIPGNSKFGNELIALINTEKPELEYDYVFAPPMSDAPVEKTVEGKAFVNFVVNRTELNPDYMINRQEIQKILNSIDIVKQDTDAIITNVHIKGFASPEGPYDNNVRLAKGRTETLANYVNNLYKFQKGIMTTSYDPEDWAGLRNYITDSMNFNINNRQEILTVIDGPLGFDAKDLALKTRFPQDYQVILKQIYPWLRHSDYTVKYSIKVYTDINELRRLYNSDPTKLRPVDFYTLAQQYPEGSEQFFDVMKKAVEVYPDDPMLNLNVANYYLKEGDFEAAQSCLLKAGLNPQANFARGVLAAKRKDYREAKKYFQMSQEAGYPQADKYMEQIEKLSATPDVEIVVPTTK
ncbi:MAG: DUF3868 domain-containing protein [Muribaculaceae bacterium]|nr:DUF3868 domain-containing protein [Muribaculaceae bacterium]